MNKTLKLTIGGHIVDLFEDLEELLDEIDDLNEYEDNMELCLFEEGIYE